MRHVPTSAEYDAQLYWKDFYRRAHRSLPHHMLLAGSARLHLWPLAKVLDWQQSRSLKKQADLRPYPDTQVAEYLEACRNVELWHGTGRYQYDAAGTIIDVLDAIATHGSLKPVYDAYTVLLGGEPTVSVSVTPLRSIARSYADIHGHGMFETHRYGSCLFWVSYLYGKYYFEQNVIHRRTKRRNWDRWKQEASKGNKDGNVVWGKKVHRQATYVWDVFTPGSDIAGNYPVLFAIKPGLERAALQTSLAKYEVRITEPVEWASVAFLEVPEQQIEATRQLLQRHGVTVPIFAVELGEFVASRQSFRVLMGYSKADSRG